MEVSSSVAPNGGKASGVIWRTSSAFVLPISPAWCWQPILIDTVVRCMPGQWHWWLCAPRDPTQFVSRSFPEDDLDIFPSSTFPLRLASATFTFPFIDKRQNGNMSRNITLSA